MDTQTGVEDISQNTMAAKSTKRSRSVSTSRRFSKRSKAGRVSRVRRTWPLASMGMGPLFDPFPAKITAIMRYSQTLVLDPAAGLTASNLFRANSIYDPDFTGTGHQPYGHDTYAQIYNHYNVRSAIITVTPTSTQAGIVGCALTDDSTVQGDYDVVRELKGTKIAVMAVNSPAPTVKNYYNVNQNFDIPYQKATSASFGQSPSEGMVFHVFVEGPSEGANMGSVSLLVNITYTVDMWELKDLGLS